MSYMSSFSTLRFRELIAVVCLIRIRANLFEIMGIESPMYLELESKVSTMHLIIAPEYKSVI